MKLADAIVVGAGVAGLSAACRLKGWNVVVLERRESVVALHRACTGIALPWGARMEMRGDDIYLPALELLVQNGIRRRLRRLLIRGASRRAEFVPESPVLLLNEGRIRGALLREARNRGCHIEVDSPVRSVSLDGERPEVRAEQTWQGQIVIGADGASSVVARSLGERRKKLGMLFAREYLLERMDLPQDCLYLQLDRPGQWAVAFHDGNAFRAMMVRFTGPRGDAAGLDVQLDDWAERMGAGRILDSRVAMVRLLDQASDCCREGALLCGDSAAFASFAGIKGAMAAGILAGDIATRLLAGSRYALSDYRKSLARAVGYGWLRKLAYLAPVLGRIDGERLDAILESASDSKGRLMDGAALWLRLPLLAMKLVL